MSEQKAPRSLVELQQEYARLCANAGQMQYQIFDLQKNLDLVNEQLREVNLEASTVKQSEEKKEQV